MLGSGARTQLCHRVCLLGGAVSMVELDNNGCAEVPCRVSTARNELEGQLAVCPFSKGVSGPSSVLPEQPLSSLCSSVH